MHPSEASMKSDIGAVADAVTAVVSVTHEVAERKRDEHKQSAFEKWQRDWQRAVAENDADRMSALLAERRTEFGIRLPVASASEADLHPGDEPDAAA